MDNLNEIKPLLLLFEIDNEIITQQLFDKSIIIQKIQERIEHLFLNERQKLTFLFYKLDISEKQIANAIYKEENGSKKIATLIYERQLKKYKSRKKITESFNKNVDYKNISDDLKW